MMIPRRIWLYRPLELSRSPLFAACVKSFMLRHPDETSVLDDDAVAKAVCYSDIPRGLSYRQRSAIIGARLLDSYGGVFCMLPCLCLSDMWADLEEAFMVMADVPTASKSWLLKPRLDFAACRPSHPVIRRVTAHQRALARGGYGSLCDPFASVSVMRALQDSFQDSLALPTEMIRPFPDHDSRKWMEEGDARILKYWPVVSLPDFRLLGEPSLETLRPETLLGQALDKALNPC